MTKRGYFILFEGCDGSGKSTQARLLAESQLLNPRKQMCFPDRTTEIGKMINQYLQKKGDLNDYAIHLLFSANRWELSDQIQKLLNDGISIICDRYWYSGVAYSAAKGLPLEWCKNPDVGIPQPDLVLFFDADLDVLAKRPGYGEERYEKSEFQKKVRDVFIQLKDENWVMINANQPIEAVTSDVQKVVKEFIQNHPH